MADDADRAFEFATVELSASLGRIQAAIPPGAPGECEECGEQMPRLVGGRCGFCRDGRRPPLSAYDRLPPVIPPEKETVMGSTPKATDTFRAITIPARDGILIAIQERAAERDLPLGQAAISWIEDGMIASALVAPDYIELAEASVDELLAELRTRLGALVEVDERLGAAIMRADEAERKLAGIAAMLVPAAD